MNLKVEGVRESSDSINVDVQQSNINQIVALSAKKSEGMAFLLTFFFGPFGLIYVNSKKAVNYILVSTGATFLLFIILEDAGYFPALLIWAITALASIVVSMEEVRKYNDALLNIATNSQQHTPVYRQELNVRNMKEILPTYSTIDATEIRELALMIANEKKKTLFDSSDRDRILWITKKLCNTKENALQALSEYNALFSSDLIVDLTSMSKSYHNKQMNILPFIQLGIVNNEFPHERIEN